MGMGRKEAKEKYTCCLTWVCSKCVSLNVFLLWLNSLIRTAPSWSHLSLFKFLLCFSTYAMPSVVIFQHLYMPKLSSLGHPFARALIPVSVTRSDMDTLTSLTSGHFSPKTQSISSLHLLTMLRVIRFFMVATWEHTILSMVLLMVPWSLILKKSPFSSNLCRCGCSNTSKQVFIPTVRRLLLNVLWIVSITLIIIFSFITAGRVETILESSSVEILQHSGFSSNWT